MTLTNLQTLKFFNFVYLGCQPFSEGVFGQLSLREPGQISIQVRQLLGQKLFIFSTNIREATFEEQEGRTDARTGVVDIFISS